MSRALHAITRAVRPSAARPLRPYDPGISGQRTGGTPREITLGCAILLPPDAFRSTELVRSARGHPRVTPSPPNHAFPDGVLDPSTAIPWTGHVAAAQISRHGAVAAASRHGGEERPFLLCAAARTRFSRQCAHAGDCGGKNALAGSRQTPFPALSAGGYRLLPRGLAPSTPYLDLTCNHVSSP